MPSSHVFKTIPGTRIATFDTFSAGLLKHHIAALLEFDVTDSRKKLRDIRKNGINISFNAWLIKMISDALQKHPEAAAYLYNKKKLIVFNDINVSVIVEKEIGSQKVPVPLVIEKTNEKTALDISLEIEKAKKQTLSGNDVVLQKEAALSERLYYVLPGFLRRMVWRIMLGNPVMAFGKMGNVVVTSVGMAGKINGWFIHKSVHPVSFGIGSVLSKPVVVDNEIKIREILNMTILVDHDVIDGAPMVRFLKDLTDNIEHGYESLNTNG